MELTQEKMQVQADSALDEAAKTDKVAELDQQIAEVKRMAQETPRM